VTSNRSAISPADSSASQTSRRISRRLGSTVDRDGEVLLLDFPEIPEPFRLRRDRADEEEVVWTSIGGFPPHWSGTVMTWQLTDNPDGSGTRVDFRHAGFAEGDPGRVAAYAMDGRHDAEWTQGIREAALTREADGGGSGVGAEVTPTAYFLGKDLRDLERRLRPAPHHRRSVMAYDEGLAERIRARLGGDPAIGEKRMFGCLVFLHAGNMAVGVTGDELMVRVGPDAAGAAPARPGARVFDFTGRPGPVRPARRPASGQEDCSCRIAGSDRPAAPVSTLPAKRRWKSAVPDAVTVTSYQRRVFFSGTL
jgi:hypothetical protein